MSKDIFGKKEEKNRLREDNLIKVYKSAFDGDEFDDDYYSSMYFLDNADSPRYYPDDAEDLATSLRYYPEDPMDEDDKSQLI